ncbi:MAG: RnfABCDGE type electron transport complex subunit D [Gammaproteobacteria bacterium]
MKFSVDNAPHWLGAEPVAVMMRRVLYALIPVILVSTWMLGPGTIINLIFAALACWCLEVLALKLRNRPVQAFASDGSVLITACLLALALPPNTPWWVTAVACLFAVVFAKHLYGGLGYNVFNPAMVGYVVVLISFPEQLSAWPGMGNPSLGLEKAFGAFFQGNLALDTLSGATPLDTIRIQLNNRLTMNEVINSPEFDNSGWILINLSALAGGAWLLRRNVIRWHIPFAMLGALALLYSLFWIFADQSHADPLFGLFSGGTMLAAFFVATDPVSAASSDRGRLIYGAGIGVLTFVIREWGAYPDGIAFAVLLMNMAAPLIDRYTVPRVYGHRERP